MLKVFMPRPALPEGGRAKSSTGSSRTAVVAHAPLLAGLAVSEHLQEQRAGIYLRVAFFRLTSHCSG